MLAATSAALRIAMMPFPQVKPVLAIAIISGRLLGMGGGFLVGALSMLMSNMIFGQGPWTIWQMLGAGICGAIFGIKKKDRLLNNRWFLSISGGVVTFLIYGMILNIASAYMFNPAPSWRFIMAFWAQGLIFDGVHGVATSVFILAFYDIMRKLVTAYFRDSHPRSGGDVSRHGNAP